MVDLFLICNKKTDENKVEPSFLKAELIVLSLTSLALKGSIEDTSKLEDAVNSVLWFSFLLDSNSN